MSGATRRLRVWSPESGFIRRLNRGRTATAARSAGEPGKRDAGGDSRFRTCGSPCSNSIFDEPWWLDAVAPGDWSEVTIEKGGRTIARWPFVARCRFGVTVLSDVPGAKLLGPWISPGPGKYATRLSRHQQLLDQLVDLLPSYAVLNQNFHYNQTDWLPLYWRGFRQTTRYSYRLPDLGDLTAIWKEMRENIRREIRKAERHLVVDRDADVEALEVQLGKTCERQGRRHGLPTGLLQRMYNAARNREQGKIYTAVDSGGRVHASIFVIWNRQSAFYLLGGGDPELRSSGAHSLLLWDAIQDLSGKTEAFDFEGSMVRPVERFFRAFGGRQTPYFQIAHTSSHWVDAALAIRRTMRMRGRSIRGNEF